MLVGGKAQFTINIVFFLSHLDEDHLIGGNNFKSVFKNSARAPLATVS